MSPPLLPSTPETESPAIRALLAPWRAEQERRRSRPFQVLALEFQIEPMNAPAPAGGMFLIDWPRKYGESQWAHNAHPDRTVMQTRAGDVLVKGRERWRVRAVKIYRSFPVLDERMTHWCTSVEDAVWAASN
jgi:hypothetical protein